jgi:hypothetical protein
MSLSRRGARCRIDAQRQSDDGISRTEIVKYETDDTDLVVSRGRGDLVSSRRTLEADGVSSTPSRIGKFNRWRDDSDDGDLDDGLGLVQVGRSDGGPSRERLL